VSSVWVVNASPIITLAKIGQQSLLEKLCDRLIVPESVAQEILAGPTDDPAFVLLRSGWGVRSSPINIPQTLLEWGLGKGETAVLATALQTQSSTAILDDASARAAARTFNVPLMGTLGVILRAKLHRYIPSAGDALRQLKTAGLFLDDRVVRQALEQIGERWD